MYPKIYLAVDNCFAYKRWTAPAEWCRVAADLNIRYVEASADNELDPLFMGPDYLADWVEDVRRAQQETGVRVANLYSGHGTYTTLGLTHTDPRVRRRMVEEWFQPMLRMAGELGAGMGFYAHAFPERVLQDPAAYAESVEILTENLAALNRYAGQVGCGDLGLEQMYTPHQYPWTIEQTRALLREVTGSSGRPFYFTEDVGHHQQKFRRPSREQLAQAMEQTSQGLWLGTDMAYALAQAGDLDAVEAEMDRNPHLFATAADGDCYAWLKILGCYSPIVHLQQTNGRQSAHLPFTEEHNRHGIIDGHRVLDALRQAYEQPVGDDMPRRCAHIYLTLELFMGTAAIPRDFLEDYRASVAYWRQFVPRDGMGLDELAQRAQDMKIGQ